MAPESPQPVGVFPDLEVLLEVASAAGLEQIRDEILSLASRLQEGRFFVACLGQFKRGKSSVLNALVGEPILPVGVVPVTTAVTILRHGPDRRATVTYRDGRSEAVGLADIVGYVAEAHNPENVKAVAAVEAFLPAPLLASGLCLVDTPGIGSIFAGNTEVTRAFLPHIDAALVVLGADPPISGDELALVEEVADQVRDVIVVLNKADRLSDAERAEASAFMVRVVETRLGRSVGPLFDVSVVERLETGGPTRDWASFEQRLRQLAAGSAEVIEGTYRRGLRRLREQLLHALDEERKALTRPILESERRADALQQSAADAERALRELGALFTVEQVDLGRTFRSRQDDVLRQALPAAAEDLRRAIADVPGRGATLRGRALELAHEHARRVVAAWLERMDPEGEALYRRAMNRFVSRANTFLTGLADSGDAAFARLPRSLEPEPGFRITSRFWFASLLHLTTPGLLTWLLDLVRPRRWALEAVERAGVQYLERLMVTNASRVAGDLEARVQESRRHLESELRFLLVEIAASARRALDRARSRVETGEEAVRDALAEIGALRQRVNQEAGGRR